MAAGYRPISNVVDVTNYVMHDLGQPIHAYDHARVPGRILEARPARAGETVTTLDGRERPLAEGMLVIADGEGVSGVAGIMGGASSEIADSTTAVVIEAAHFERVQVLRTSRAARPAHRCFCALREGRRSRAPAGRVARRRAPHGRLRRAHGAGRDRPPGGAAAGPGEPAPARRARGLNARASSCRPTRPRPRSRLSASSRHPPTAAGT